MNITHKFALGQHVTIIELETPAMIRQSRIDLSGLTYLCTYWADSKLQEVWLWESELSAQETA